MVVWLKHNSGITKKAKIGFSWTTFFFGLFVPLIRGDLKWAVIMLIIELLAGSVTFGIGAFIAGIVFSFVYNKIYIKELMEKGYTAFSDGDNSAIQDYI